MAATFGLIALVAAFAACLLSLVLLCIAHLPQKNGEAKRAGALVRGGRICALAVALALTVCCGILVVCFMTGDISIEYVLRNRSSATDGMAWLYKLSGLWAGRAGSLLFWAWLISVYNAVLVFATRKNVRGLDNGALVVSELVLLAFLGVLLFSSGNMPFTPTPATYFGEDGTLTQAASNLGMNMLLEHWAMAIHPPTLFIGYAGMTIPFAYAISALAVNDDSDAWVCSATPYLLFSWLFLGAGIGLGAVWAYVVLGWGGYWGWDPVENASLLPWLVGVALIHSFTIYRKRGEFKRWSIMCACLAFSFVVLGTFITRSGLVQSVHAFDGDSVSVFLFLVLIIASLLAGAIGLGVRKRTFGVAQGEGDIDSLVSRDAAYYMNNLIMVIFAVLLAYMTVASALPTFLPFGGQSLSANSYNAIARPLGVIYCALIAVCPLLGWRKTSGQAFLKRALVPGICGLVAFALLMVYFIMYLLPSYDAMVASGGSGAENLLEQGSPIYYNGLAVVGFLVASLLFFNAAFMVVQSFRHEGAFGLRQRLAKISGGISHAAIGIILVGLIGSSMYVTEVSEYLAYDPDTDTCVEPLRIQDFELTYTGNSIETTETDPDVIYRMYFDVTRNGTYVGSVAPGMEVVKATLQQKLEASVLGFPTEDLFVVYNGVDTDGSISMDVRVNPLIDLVWIGFVLLMIGAVLSLFASRGNARKLSAAPHDANGVREDTISPEKAAS